jgi:hypothetical protein
MLVARFVSIPSDRAVRKMPLKPVVPSQNRQLAAAEAMAAGLDAEV